MQIYHTASPYIISRQQYIIENRNKLWYNQYKGAIALLFSKKKKLIEYLSKKQAEKALTTFDIILSDYLSGSLKKRLHELAMKKISIHIDWLPDYKCIIVQGKFSEYYFDIQIEPEAFSIAYDKDEPDDATEFVLQDVSSFYSVIENAILKIK